MVFQWQNDGSNRSLPPAAVDNISLTSCLSSTISVTDGTRCGTGTVELSAVGSTGTTEYRWYTSPTDGTYVSTLTGNFTTPVLTQSQNYFVSAFNGCSESIRTKIKALVFDNNPTAITQSDNSNCSGPVTLNITGGNTSTTNTLFSEDFETGSTSQLVVQDFGSSTNAFWYIEDSPSNFVSYATVDSGSNFFVAIDTNFDFNGFANNAVTMNNSINTTNYSNLELTFNHYYRYYGDLPDEGLVEINTDGDINGVWTTVASYNSDQGSPNNFNSVTINLDSYVNEPSLRVRFRYNSEWNWGWNIDDITITGTTNGSTVVWTPNTGLFQDASLTSPYNNENLTTVYANPDVDTIYSLSISNIACSDSNTVSITRYNKTWLGLNSDWNDPLNWSPTGVPTINDCVNLDGNASITGTNYYAFSKIINVENTGNINVTSGNTLIVNESITIETNGVLEFENDATLLQIENASNTGQINYKRTANNINGYDYVYWSSPVFGNGTIGQNINTIYSSPTPGPKYFWNTIANNNNGALGNIGQGLWQNAFNQVMETGKGYIMRGSNNLNLSPTDIESTFIGIPTNGDLNIPIQRGDYTGLPYNGINGAQITNLSDNFNLIGNPYPSAINILEFLSQNSSVILGNVNLWQHSDGLSNSYNNPFYGSFTYNYNVNNYNTINFTGSTTPSASEIIKTGQAFFVKMIDGPTTTANVIFNNSMRRDASNLPYNNSGFYRTNTNQNETVINRNRIWLDLVKDNNCERTLIGYVDGATNLEDHFYDARLRLNRMLIYSLMNEKTYSIQGKSNPFDTNDIVPIGIKAIESGNYSIAINTVDGLFEGSQEIYLKDELLNITHNLKTAPYTFTTTNGVHNNRFKIVYQNTTLDEASYDIKTVNIYKENSKIHINSGNEIMNNVTVYDISGRIIVQESAIDNNSITIDISNIQDQVLIVNIVTSEGITITKKIL